jgi:hypothetical protein
MNTEDKSDAWIRQGANVLAAALAVFIVLPAIYPMPRAFSAVDGTLWAAWAQVGAILATGGGATLVAWTQLRRFNENARARTTIHYMDAYSYGLNQLPNSEPLTVSTATSYLTAALEDESLMTRLHKEAKQWHSPAPKPVDAEASDELKQYLFYDGAFVAAANYFSRTAGLAEEDLIDGRLFLDFYALQVVTVWRFTKAFSDVDPSALAFYLNPHFKKFAEQASEAFVSDPKPVI